MSHRGTRNKDDCLAAAIAAGMSVMKAAEKAGVSRRTAHRRLNEPEFKQQVANLRAAMLDQALGRLTSGLSSAVVTLKRALRSRKEAARINAAKAILDRLINLRSHCELEDRIASLEGMIDAKSARTG